MAIMRYKLALPDSKVGKHRGVMISNFETLNNDADPIDYLRRPPIKVTLLKGNRKSWADCLVAAKDSWFRDMENELIKNWRLTEVEFHRRSPRLGFRTDGTGVENLYIADDASVVLAFEVYREDNLPPYVYIVDHQWQLFGPKDRSTYLTHHVEKTLDGKVLQRIEFDISTNPEDRTPKFYAEHPEKYITITEIC